MNPFRNWRKRDGRHNDSISNIDEAKKRERNREAQKKNIYTIDGRALLVCGYTCIAYDVEGKVAFFLSFNKNHSWFNEFIKTLY